MLNKKLIIAISLLIFTLVAPSIFGLAIIVSIIKSSKAPNVQTTPKTELQTSVQESLPTVEVVTETISPSFGQNKVIKHTVSSGNCYFEIDKYNEGWSSRERLSDTIFDCNTRVLGFPNIDQFLFAKGNTLIIYYGNPSLSEEYKVTTTVVGNESETIYYVSKNLEKILTDKGIYNIKGTKLADFGAFEGATKFFDQLNEVVVFTKRERTDTTSKAKITLIKLADAKINSIYSKEYTIPADEVGRGCGGESISSRIGVLIVTLGGCVTYSQPEELELPL